MDNKELISIFNKTNEWINILQTNRTHGFPKDWTGLKEVQLAHIILMNKLIDKEHSAPSYTHERGIVIGAGGAKYFACAFSCFYILRQLGCNLPVEFWYLDEYEMDNAMKHMCDIHNIKYVNANKYCIENNLNPRILNGWELKPFSTLYSDIREVLYLDADNIPVKDPSYLFDLPEYVQLGSIFWPDLPPHKRKQWLPPICWENVGIEYINEVDFETGQYLINKSKCYKELTLTLWMNEHSDWFYKFVYGDKSTFHLAWRKCKTDYVITSKSAGWRKPSILQYDTKNGLLFQHACQGKENIYNGTIPIHHKNYEMVRSAKTEREKYWSGIIYSWKEMNEEEKKIAHQYIGSYKYERIGLDHRTIELLDNGEIGVGKDRCERRWSIRIIDGIPTIIVIGAAHKDSEIAMFFAKDDGTNKIFNGRWTAFEKCEIVMEKI
jgi:hypothetical protein